MDLPDLLQQIEQHVDVDYLALPPEVRRRHGELVRESLESGRLQIQLWRTEGDLAELCVCGRDVLGALSLISGVLAAESINIVDADIYTLQLPQSASSRSDRRAVRARRAEEMEPAPTERVILDQFVVRLPAAWTPGREGALRDQLLEALELAYQGQLERARDVLLGRFAATIGRMTGRSPVLYPVRIVLDNASSPSATRVDIESQDTLGFVFEFSNALATLGFNIAKVRVRTVDHIVRDVFWVTERHGSKVTDPTRLEDLRFAAVLIKQFTHLLPWAPDPALALRQFSLLARDALRWSDWAERLHDLQSDEVLKTLAEVLGMSVFLWEDFLRIQHENLFPVLSNVPGLKPYREPEELEKELQEELRKASSSDHRREVLNRFKDRHMFRIDLRHVTRCIDFPQFSKELTELAELVVRYGLAIAAEKLPEAAHGGDLVSNLVVLGLGKFGGRELGFGSDIELLFVYDDTSSSGLFDAGDGPPPYERLIQEFLKTVEAPRNGIFHIDLRLRPFGRSGPLATPLSLFESYYRHGGAAQQFERLALVKLRPIAGPPALIEHLQKVTHAFVYSGHPIDYSNILMLRTKQIDELTRRNCINAKYSPGGLVDIEYFVQVRQIEVGALCEFVRVTNTLEAIQHLEEAGALSSDLAGRLREAYGFLRRLIDALRVVRGHAQDLHLPPPESQEFRFLSSRLGNASPSQLVEELIQTMAFVRSLWPGW